MSQVNHIGKDSRIIFHFNKHSLIDKTVPMWTIKVKGSTYYVNHLDSKVGFNTKETPDNEHTKGSLKFNGDLTIITQEDGQVIANIE